MDELVDAAVSAWHESRCELHEWLGWTWEEYSAWVKDPTAIPRMPKVYAAIKETHAIVPKEPTEAMLEGFGHHKHRVAINYKAMLEASPKL